MKYAVVSFSGNVGKSVVATHLLFPRVPNAELISVESINADEGGDASTVRGKQFGALQEQLMMLDAAVVDIGASNVEDFIKLMSQYRGSHEDFDLFVIPAVKEAKQIRDTISTIQALKAMGVPAKKIRVIFNKLETDETVDDVFYPLIAFHEAEGAFTLKKNAVIHYSELFQKLRSYQLTIPGLLADETDYKAQLRETADPEVKAHCAAMISMRRLATSANENLDQVFKALTSNK